MRHGKTKVARSTGAGKRANAIQLKHEEESSLDFIKRVRDGYDQLPNTMRMKAMRGNGSRPNMEKIEEAVRKKLARAPGQSIEKIDQCLCHGEYLSEHCLTKLEKTGAGEGFFLKAQHLKAILIKNALVKGLGKQEITNEISAAILEMYREYQETRRVNATRWLKDRIGRSETKPSWASGTEIFGKPRALKHRSRKNPSSVPKPLTPIEISARLEELARKIRKDLERRKEGRHDLVRELGRFTIEMAKLHQEARHRSVSAKERERDG